MILNFGKISCGPPFAKPGVAVVPSFAFDQTFPVLLLTGKHTFCFILGYGHINKRARVKQARTVIK
jgi:hypothetical protein